MIVWDTTTYDLWLYGDLGPNPTVNQGDTVRQGQQIGVEGNPGSTSSTGLHVHLEKENRSDGIFQYGYANSIDPTTGTGITNAVDGTVYIYDGTPIPPTPPTPTIGRGHFPWFLIAKKLRNNRI